MDLVVQIATLVGIAAAGIVLYLQWWAVRRQAHVDVFLAYTERCGRIMARWPPGAWASRFDQRSLREPSPELTIVVLDYLNLCSQEYDLHQHKLLYPQVWRIWEEEIERTLSGPLFAREWPDLRDEFASYPHFREFVDAACGSAEDTTA